MVAVSLALFIYRFAIRSWASVARSLWYSWATCSNIYLVQFWV